ncbi:MAG: fibrobacter succinogenes major paralogous domain-containing protein [Bacteroidetes bacterium]|nr:fibrobacter succinogenes major paralogous domain-containing protein [Bacteroidota bacterium]
MKKNIATLNIKIVSLIVLLIVAFGCKKEEEVIIPETGTVTDIDNNIYKTIKIGSMVLNENIFNSAGALYNWYAIHNSNKISPDGWHVPTDEDWKILEKYLGMSVEQSDKSGWRGSNEGDKLKITGEDNWQTFGSVWATNESGFSAFAFGCRLYNGSWSTPIGSVYMGFWWTDSEKNINEGLYRYLDYKRSQIFRSHILKSYGLSVRCIKD